MKKVFKIFAISILVLIILGYGLKVWMNSRSFQVGGNLINRIDTTDRVVALTFDDGPTERTQGILDILNHEEIKATFFLVGESVAQNPKFAQAIMLQGSEIGNHSYTHKRMVFKSPSFIKKELEMTDSEIRKIGYDKLLNFRPPYGKKLILLPWYVNKLDKKTITWDVEVDSSKSADEIAQHVIDHIRPGSIILLHPMYNNSDLAAIPKIISVLKQQGYKFVTVSQLLVYSK